MALREGGFVQSLGPIRATPFHGAAYTAGTSANMPPRSPHGPLAWAEMGWIHPGDQRPPP